MAKEIKTIDYDSESDILFISNNEKVKNSIEIGDFVLDINPGNLIGGVEIIDASTNIGIEKNFLEKIKNIKMSVNYSTTSASILLVITFTKENKEVNIPIPLNYNLGHKKSQKDVLVYC